MLLLFFLFFTFIFGEPTLNCLSNTWVPLTAGWSALGTVTVDQVSLTTAQVTVVQVTELKDDTDQLVSGEFVGHVHELACNDNDGGAHFQFTPMAMAVQSNELWFGPANTSAPGQLSGAGPSVMGTMRPADMLSFVVHQRINGTAPKRICCNLIVAETAAAATSTTSAAAMNAETTTTTVPGNQGGGTAGMTTTNAQQQQQTMAPQPAPQPTPAASGNGDGSDPSTTTAAAAPTTNGGSSQEECAGQPGCECAGPSGTCEGTLFQCAGRSSSQFGVCLRPLGQLCQQGSGSPGCPCGGLGACSGGSVCQPSPVNDQFRVCIQPLDGSVTEAPAALGPQGPFSFITDLIPGVPEWAVPVAGGVLLLLLIAICFCVVRSCNSGGGGGGRARNNSKYESPSVAIAMKEDSSYKVEEMNSMMSPRDAYGVDDDDDSALFMPSAGGGGGGGTSNHYQAAPHNRPPPPTPPGAMSPSANPGAGRPPPPPPPGV